MFITVHTYLAPRWTDSSIIKLPWARPVRGRAAPVFNFVFPTYIISNSNSILQKGHHIYSALWHLFDYES